MQALGFKMTTEQSASPTAGAERSLVKQAQTGDSAAFEQLYRTHAGRVYGLCLRMLGDPAAAEDCAQEAFIRAWRKLDTFRAQSAFGTWLHRIAVNEVLARQRKERRHPHLQLVNEADISETPERPDTGIDINGAIRELPKGARNVFVLYAVNGYSHQETADMLGVAVGTCKAQLHRARKLLVKRLEL